MKFLVEKEPLTDAVNWVARSLSVRPIQTSLLGIVINVDDEIKLIFDNNIICYQILIIIRSSLSS